jgi:hypothetical protein
MNTEILLGDCRALLPSLPAESVHCVVTSPPYFGLRDYGHPDQIGLEKTPEEYVAGLVDVFRQVGRVLRPDGTVWLNLGDSYMRAGPGGLVRCRSPALWNKQRRRPHSRPRQDARPASRKRTCCGDSLAALPWPSSRTAGG